MRFVKWMASAAAVAAVFAAAALMAAQTRPSAGASLEGTRWMVTVTPDEHARAKGEKPFEDTLVFESNKVTMTECAKHGFGASGFKQSKTKEGMSFQTTQESAAEGESTWKGDVSGDSIRGTMKWKKKDGAVLHYTFEGKKATG